MQLWLQLHRQRRTAHFPHKHSQTFLITAVCVKVLHSSGCSSVMCVECCMCPSCFLNSKTDRLFLWVCGGGCRRREIVPFSCCRSGGQVARDCHSLSLAPSVIPLFSTPHFKASVSASLPLIFHLYLFSFFFTDALKWILVPFYKPCSPLPRVWRCRFKPLILSLSLFYQTLMSFTNQIDIAVLEVHIVGHACALMSVRAHDDTPWYICTLSACRSIG